MGMITTKLARLSDRELYLQTDDLLAEAEKNASLIEMRNLSRKHAHYIMSASAEAVITFPPLYLCTLFSKAVEKGIKFAEKHMSKRPAAAAGISIEASFWWTPDPISEIVAISLIGASATAIAFEKLVGEETANKFYKPFYSAFNYAAGKIPSKFKTSISQKFSDLGKSSLGKNTQSFMSKIGKNAQSFMGKIREEHSRSPAMTVFQPDFMK